MNVIPAVDVQGGRCVRLRRGEHAQETIYADDPVLAGRRFIDAGATRLHVVDLDAARGVPAQDSSDAVARLVVTCLRLRQWLSRPTFAPELPTRKSRSTP